jgi:hypothetical protein
MKKFLFFSAFIVILFTSCDKFRFKSFSSDWDKSPDGTWTGKDCWANRLQDWCIKEGRLECLSTLPMRTVHLMSGSISEKRGNISSSVTIFATGREKSDGSSAGILLGAGSGLDYRAASLVFHSWGNKAGIYAGLDSKGNLFIRDLEKENYFFVSGKKNNISWAEARLMLNVTNAKGGSKIRILAVNPSTNIIIDKAEYEGIPSERLSGNIALVSHAGNGSTSDYRYSFSGWKVSGSRIEKNDGWNSGPIVTAQYTLSRNTLKLTGQFMPIGEEENHQAILQIYENEKWTNADTAFIENPSFTAQFRIENWKRETDVDYRINYDLERKREKRYFLSGIIKHDPVEKDTVRMLSLSCIEQIIRPDGKEYFSIDGGRFNYPASLLYPHKTLTDNLKKFNTDLLFFAGDQVYEGSSPTRPDFDHANLDYLYKWYLWCLTYKDLTTRIPTITIPDDHDVFHGNLWGEGGKATPQGLSGSEAQDEGGYKMPPEFVNMVQATQTSHLPDPVDPRPAEQGISVYFTDCNIGGISFAIIEDRKFKSAPKNLFPEADIFNGWPRNMYWNARHSSRTGKLSLLGERQMTFLEKWSADWSNNVWMKVALSQTLFANLATIPGDSLTDDVVPLMPIPDSGKYIQGDRLATDFDSDGWPQVERDKAIKIFRKAFAIHVAGDQHLGSTVQYGTDEFRDAGYAIVSPATGNIWPRHWFPAFPGSNRETGWPANYGDFEDGFGNKITVFAVANPHISTVEPVRHNQYSTGYSAITFYKNTREIELANWPYYADPEKDKPFPSWPVRINQTDNYGRNAVAWLPEIKVEGLIDPVVKVIREYTGEIIYSLRISGTTFQAKVFEYGSYKIEVGEPDKEKWKTVEKLYPTAFKEREPVVLKF